MRKYKVKRGDNLTKIAKMFQVTVEAIKRANNLASDVIQPDQELIIPTTLKTLIPKKFEFKGVTMLYERTRTEIDKTAVKIYKPLKVKSNCCSSECRKPWVDLIKFDPRTVSSVQKSLDKRNLRDGIKKMVRVIALGPGSAIIDPYVWGILPIDNAYGEQLNMDYYSVKITKLPTKSPRNNLIETPGDLFEYIRKNLGHIEKNLGLFLDSNIATFYAYDDDEELTWHSKDPITTVMKFHVILPYTAGLGYDDASVMCTAFVPGQSWTFSPVQNPIDNQHPVSGNRQFGLRKIGNNYEFYVRGADRLTGIMDETLGETAAFAGADELWSGFQKNLIAFIEKYGGEAEIDLSKYVSKRCKWKTNSNNSDKKK